MAAPYPTIYNLSVPVPPSHVPVCPANSIHALCEAKAAMQQESIDFLRKEAWRYNAKVALQQETIDLLRKEALRYNGFFIRILKLGLFDRLWFAFTRQLPESVFDINRE